MIFVRIFRSPRASLESAPGRAGRVLALSYKRQDVHGAVQPTPHCRSAMREGVLLVSSWRGRLGRGESPTNPRGLRQGLILLIKKERELHKCTAM